MTDHKSFKAQIQKVLNSAHYFQDGDRKVHVPVRWAFVDTKDADVVVYVASLSDQEYEAESYADEWVYTGLKVLAVANDYDRQSFAGYHWFTKKS